MFLTYFQRLQGINQEHSGKIYGILAKNTLVVLGLQLEIQDCDGTDLINCFPAEIDLCGIINIGDGFYNEQTLSNKLTEVYVTDNPLFIKYKVEDDEISAYFYKNGQLEASKYSVISEQDILSQFLHVQLKSNLFLSCECNEDSLKEAFLNLRKIVASGCMGFGFKHTSVYLLGSDNEGAVIGVSGNPGVGELCNEANDPSEGNTRRKKTHFDIDILKVEMLKNVTKVMGDTSHAPLCVLDKS